MDKEYKEVAAMIQNLINQANESSILRIAKLTSELIVAQNHLTDAHIILTHPEKQLGDAVAELKEGYNNIQSFLGKSKTL